MSHLRNVVQTYVDAGSGSYIVLVIFALLMAAYVVVATLVGKAAAKKGRSQASWTVIALCFGVIIPAVIVAVIAPLAVPAPVLDSDLSKKCPYCAESIHVEAIKCKHCGEMLNI